MKSPAKGVIMIGLTLCVSAASLAQDKTSKLMSAPTADEHQSDIIATAKTLITKVKLEEARLLLTRIDAKTRIRPNRRNSCTNAQNIGPHTALACSR